MPDVDLTNPWLDYFIEDIMTPLFDFVHLLPEPVNVAITLIVSFTLAAVGVKILRRSLQ